jgi:hypothetical protein
MDLADTVDDAIERARRAGQRDVRTMFRKLA